MGCGDGDRRVPAYIIRRHDQEIRGGNIRGIAVAAEIGVIAALGIVQRNRVAFRSVRILDRPFHLVRNDSPRTAAVVGGNDFLQTNVGAQIVKTVVCIRTQLVQQCRDLAAVVQNEARFGFVASASRLAAGGAAHLAEGNVLQDQFQQIVVIHCQHHGVHAPRVFFCIAGVDRDGIGFFQALKGAHGVRSERDRTAGGILHRTDFSAGGLDGVLHLDVLRCGCQRVANGGDVVFSHIIAAELIQGDCHRALLHRQQHLGGQIHVTRFCTQHRHVIARRSQLVAGDGEGGQRLGDRAGPFCRIDRGPALGKVVDVVPVKAVEL